MGPQQGSCCQLDRKRRQWPHSLPHTLDRNSSLWFLPITAHILRGPKANPPQSTFGAMETLPLCHLPSRGRKKPRARTSLDVVTSVTPNALATAFCNQATPRRFLNNQGIRSREVLWRLVSSSEVSYSSSHQIHQAPTEGQALHPLWNMRFLSP